MKKFFSLLLSIFILFVVILVLKQQSADSMISVDKDVTISQASYQAQGYVIFKDEKIYFIEEQEIKDSNITGYIEQSLKKEHPSDFLLNFNDLNAAKDLETGDKIKIWVNEILESYPGRYNVTKYEKIK